MIASLCLSFCAANSGRLARIKSKLGNVGFEAFSSSPKELEDFVKVQLGKWGKMVKDAGIQPE